MKKLSFRVIILFSLLFAVQCLMFSSAQALDIKRSVLDNGLTVLHVERHNLPTVMVTMLVKASPFNEPADKAGLANLTAALLMEGTKKREAAGISEEIEFIGASLAPSVDNDFTTVTLSVLRKDVDKGLEMLSDILLNPVFPEDEIARNKELIKGNLRQSEEDPSFIATKAFIKAVFGDSPYGRLVRGSVETIDRIKREDIVKFHTDFYRPNNSVISVVGDINDNDLHCLLNSFFSGWKPAAVPEKISVPTREESRRTIPIDKNITQANIILGHAGIDRGNPDYYAVYAMNYILGGGGFSSRLMQAVREEKGLAYDIHSYFGANKYGGFFEVGVQTKNASANEVISEVLKQIRQIREKGISDKELEDAKAYLTGSFPRRLDTNRKIADFLAAVEFYGLGLDYVEKYPKYIASTTKEDILRTAKKYLDPDNYVLVVVGRQSEAKLPEENNEKK